MVSLKKNLLYQTAYKLLLSAAPLITTPYLSRVLGASNLGIFSYRQSIINFFLLFAMLGVSTYGTQRMAAERDNKELMDKTFWEIYSIQFIASFVMTILYALYILWFCKEYILISWIFGFYLIGDLLDVSWYFYGVEEINITSIRGMVIKLLSVASVFLFVKSGDDLWKYAVIVAGATALGQIIIWPAFLSRVQLIKPTLSGIKKHIKPILILFVPLAAVSVYHIMDKVMLGMLSDTLNSGYYYSADKVINVPIVIITGIHAVFLPRVTNMFSRGKTEGEMVPFLSETMIVTLALCSSMACGIAAVSDEFVPLFFGAGYEPCSSLIKVFALVMIAKSLSSAMRNMYIIPTQRDSIYVWSVILGAVVNLIANYVLIYVLCLGAMGATLGTLLAEASAALFDVVMCNRVLPELKPAKTIMKGINFLASGVVMYVLIRILRNVLCVNLSTIVALIIEIISGVIIYLLFVIIYSKYKKVNVMEMVFSSRKNNN